MNWQLCCRELQDYALRYGKNENTFSPPLPSPWGEGVLIYQDGWGVPILFHRLPLCLPIAPLAFPCPSCLPLEGKGDRLRWMRCSKILPQRLPKANHSRFASAKQFTPQAIHAAIAAIHTSVSAATSRSQHRDYILRLKKVHFPLPQFVFKIRTFVRLSVSIYFKYDNILPICFYVFPNNFLARQ